LKKDKSINQKDLIEIDLKRRNDPKLNRELDSGGKRVLHE